LQAFAHDIACHLNEIFTVLNALGKCIFTFFAVKFDIFVMANRYGWDYLFNGIDEGHFGIFLFFIAYIYQSDYLAEMH
jgi:hypothetical protein